MINLSRKYNAIRTKAHFTGINNPSQSILFLSNSGSFLTYNHRISVCQHPGQNKYRRLLPFFRDRKSQRAPCGTTSSSTTQKCKGLQGSLGVSGVWDQYACDRIQYPGTRKMAQILKILYLTTGVSRRALRDNAWLIHRISTRLYT
jgi:hypothetical protein